MIVSENIVSELNNILLTEGVETKNMKVAKHYLYDKMGYNEQQAMKCIGQIKTDIPNSRLGKCKFILAMVRMYVNGDFQDGQTIMNVNKCLKYVASDAHINEYNQDLNGLTAEEFIERFSGNAQQDLEQDKNDVSSQEYDTKNSQYEIVKITSFDESEEYGEYVSWCVTQDEDMFESYTSNGNGVFYFCLRNGWQEEDEIKGEGCPLDSYGLSMIAVSVNNDGSCNTITCRWNHENGGNDHIMTPKQLSQVVGRNFYETFKPLTPDEINRNLQMKIFEIQEEIEGQMYYEDSIEDITEVIEYDPDYGDVDKRNIYSFRSEKGNYVLLYEDGEFVIDMVFQNAYGREGDIIVVEIGNKCNFLTLDGKLLSNVWFDKVLTRFRQGYGLVCKGKKWNMLNKQGQLMLDKWYDAIGGGGYDVVTNADKNHLIQVIDNGKLNLLNYTNNQMVFEKPIKDLGALDVNNWCIRFEGDDYYMIYDSNTMKIKAPWKISKLLGFYHGFFKLQLIGAKHELDSNLIDTQCNLYNTETKQMIQANPYLNNIQKESKQNRLIEFISRKIFNNLLNEVRYIDTKTNKYNGRVTKTDWKEIYNQEPIKNNDRIRVYHGCTLKTALDWALHGTSGREWHPRTYSYENGMNPLGIFVTVDFEKAKDFGYDNECTCIVEFTANASDLESPVWNGSDSYFGQGTNPQPFKNKEERNTQKAKYDADARNIKDDFYWDPQDKKQKTISYDYIRQSDKPSMARNIFDNPEHQALFMGNLNPNMIKRIWINQREEGKNYVSTDKAYIPLTVKEFVKKYKDHEFYVDGSYGDEKRKLTTNKVYKPNEDFKGWQDFIKRDKWLSRNEKYAQKFLNDIESGNNYFKQRVSHMMFPKQIIQAFGQDFFDLNYNRLGQ